MHFLLRCIVFLSLLAIARPCDFAEEPVKAKASLSRGKLRIFSEENVELICTVPDDPLSNWDYKWYFNDNFNKSVASSQVLNLNKARVQQGGLYTCMGIKDIDCYPYEMPTNKSDPIRVEVDGGWVLLQIPHEPIIINDKLTLTCRIRDNYKLSEVIFYKEGVEIHRSAQRDLLFEDVVLQDAGKYSCNAKWLQGSEYHSAMSPNVFLPVLDKVSTPIIQFSTGKTRMFVKVGERAEIRCITQVNAREKGLSVAYYFMKDDKDLGPATSRDTYQISYVSMLDKGVYTCRVRVIPLNVERLSKDKADLRVKP